MSYSRIFTFFVDNNNTLHPDGDGVVARTYGDTRDAGAGTTTWTCRAFALLQVVVGICDNLPVSRTNGNTPRRQNREEVEGVPSLLSEGRRPYLNVVLCFYKFVPSVQVLILTNMLML